MTVTKLKIRIYGDPCLRKKSTPVKSVGSAERLLILSLLETMYEHKGIGLAAPQVGINQEIFVADVGEGPIVVVNPHIVKRGPLEPLEEGCLSIPGVVVKVRRPNKIFVSYKNEYDQTIEREYDGLIAKVIQHETDHLKGKLIIDYAGIRQKIFLRQQLKELQKTAQLL